MVNLSRMRTLIAYEQRLRFDRLKKLAKATKITTTITGMPRGSGTGNKIQDGAIELAEVEDAYREVLTELRSMREELEQRTGTATAGTGQSGRYRHHAAPVR